jgi:hypothetical protein
MSITMSASLICWYISIRTDEIVPPDIILAPWIVWVVKKFVDTVKQSNL